MQPKTNTVQQLKILGFHENKIKAAMQCIATCDQNHLNEVIKEMNQQRSTKKMRCHQHQYLPALCPLCLTVSLSIDPNQSNKYYKFSQFQCQKCCHKYIDYRLLQINNKKQNIQQQIQQIHNNHPLSHSSDIQLRCKHTRQRISSLKQSIEHIKLENEILKQKANEIKTQNQQRLHHLEQLKQVTASRWALLHEIITKESISVYDEYCSINEQLHKLSSKCLLRLYLYFPMNTSVNEKRSMIQNIVIPSLFTVENIREFYDSFGKLFAYPIMPKDSSSHSPDDAKLDETASVRPRHEIHAEHGVCAALYHIVSFLLHAFKYLNLNVLHEMGLSAQHGYPYIVDNMDGNLTRYVLYYEARNLDAFKYALNLLNENITHLCVYCGVKRNKLRFCAFVDNLIILRNHVTMSQSQTHAQWKSPALSLGNSSNLSYTQYSEKMEKRLQESNVMRSGHKSETEDESVSHDDDDSDEWEKI